MIASSISLHGALGPVGPQTSSAEELTGSTGQWTCSDCKLHIIKKLGHGEGPCCGCICSGLSVHLSYISSL